jgi:hypothetical protein
MNEQAYRYIRAWGKWLHSHSWYIGEQVDRARREGAPADAIYRSDAEGRWVTVGEITDPQTRDRVERIATGRGPA